MSDAKIPNQAEAAKRALTMKQEATEAAHPAPGQTPNEGMSPQPNRDIAPSGALDAEGHRPVVERSRKAR